MIAPIVLFAYNRADCLRNTVECLKKCALASESDLFIFVDGPKNDTDKKNVNIVLDYVRTINGFNKIKIFESTQNKGLAPSIIAGVTQIITIYKKAIVVEDDLLLSHNFLIYMNESLTRYEKEQVVFSISGYSLKIKLPRNYDCDSYFYGKPESWGWATWADRWETVDWNVSDWEEFINDKLRVKAFNRFGSQMTKLLNNSVNNKISSWYIKFAYAQFKQNKLTVYPVLSKTINNGFISEATHCYQYNRFRVNFDKTENMAINFPSRIHVMNEVNKGYYSYYSISTRGFSKIKTYLLRFGLIKQYIPNLK